MESAGDFILVQVVGEPTAIQNQLLCVPDAHGSWSNSVDLNADGISDLYCQDGERRGNEEGGGGGGGGSDVMVG